MKTFFWKTTKNNTQQLVTATAATWINDMEEGRDMNPFLIYY